MSKTGDFVDGPKRAWRKRLKNTWESETFRETEGTSPNTETGGAHYLLNARVKLRYACLVIKVGTTFLFTNKPAHPNVQLQGRPE